MLHLQVK